jgi:hypothetical protein
MSVTVGNVTYVGRAKPPKRRKIKMPTRGIGASKPVSLPQPPLDWLVQHDHISQVQADRADKGWYRTHLRYDYIKAAQEYAYECAMGKPWQGDYSEQFAYSGRARGDKEILAGLLS